MIKRSKLKNGIQIVTYPDPNSKLVTIGYVVKNGSYNEREDQTGLSHLIEHMLFKGTINRTVEQINKDIERVGGYFNACTSYTFTKYYATVPKDYWNIGADVISDLIFNHTFPEDGFKSEKEVVKEEIAMYNDDPSSFVLDKINEIMFDKYKNRQSISGTKEDIDRYTIDDLNELIETNYCANNLTVLATGNIDHEKLENFINDYIAKYKIDLEESYVTGYEEFKPYDLNSEIHKFERPDVTQTHLSFGMFGPGYDSKDIPALKLLVNILGGNNSSLLYDNIREKKGLCYTISAYIEVLNDVSTIVGYAGLNSKSDVINEITDIIVNLSDTLTDQMLEDSKKYLIGINDMRMETTAKIHNVITDKIINDDFSPLEEYVNKINSVTLEEAKEVAKKYFNKKNLCFVRLN